MIPFISRYKLSNSIPLGLAPAGSAEVEFPASSKGLSSTTLSTILGYLTESHLKRAGTPMPGFFITELTKKLKLLQPFMIQAGRPPEPITANSTLPAGAISIFIAIAEKLTNCIKS
jgi:hypothetical protein